MAHICIVSDTIHTFFGSGIEEGTGGAERQQRSIATALVEQGHRVSIATLVINDKSFEIIDDVELNYIIPDLRGFLNAPYKAVQTIRGLSRINADVYYVRGNDFLCMVTAIYSFIGDAGFIFGVANNSNVDPDLLSHRGIQRIPFLRAIKSADRVIAQTDSQWNHLQRDHGIVADIIPNGIDLPDYSAIVPHDEREYILWVGSIDPEQKKPARFLELARQLPEIKFRMIGSPHNDHPNYYDIIERDAAGIDNLQFVGFVDPDNIHEHYQQAVALVNTSDYEGFPNVFLESWAYATPVISLYFTLDEHFQGDSIGICAGSMDALVDITDRMVSDENLRQKLGHRGREHVEKNYVQQCVLSQYIQLFEEVQGQSHSKRESSTT